ncbi:MAG: hypothetical protein LKF82_04225 [Acinetobacter populi]|uniref:hypothetical protein n=1 Tax=Acinetobacter populi TaxID=1582270 RepID=UPI0023549DBE|nr:hypothetical protein [Acinetobacter populi]MCH4247035.1 hypothetical protein [Acinetobacter populi]
MSQKISNANVTSPSNPKLYTFWLVLLAASITFALTMGIRQTMGLYLSDINLYRDWHKWN